jgi:hypothetical protein
MANPKRTRKAKSSSAMPVPSPIVDRKADALRRLRPKVTPEQLATAPPVTKLLKGSFGGLRMVMQAMRFALNDEVIAAFLKKYDSIPLGERERLPWEAVCISAGVNLNHFAGSAMLAAASYCANKSKLIIATNHPEITKKRVEYALLPSGEKDRYALDVMAGAMPSAKGPTFIGKINFGTSSPALRKGNDDDDSEGEAVSTVMVDDVNQLFPQANVSQNKLVPIRQRLLNK